MDGIHIDLTGFDIVFQQIQVPGIQIQCSQRYIKRFTGNLVIFQELQVALPFLFPVLPQVVRTAGLVFHGFFKLFITQHSHLAIAHADEGIAGHMIQKDGSRHAPINSDGFHMVQIANLGNALLIQGRVYGLPDMVFVMPDTAALDLECCILAPGIV